jgi:hypothetical protein
MAYLVVCIGLTIVILLVCVHEYVVRKKKRDRFSTRSEFQWEQLREIFACGNVNDEELRKFLSDVSHCAQVPQGQLRPSDRPAVELGPIKGWELDDSIFDLPFLLSRTFGGAEEDYQLDEDGTLADLLQIAVRKNRSATQ